MEPRRLKREARGIEMEPRIRTIIWIQLTVRICEPKLALNSRIYLPRDLFLPNLFPASLGYSEDAPLPRFKLRKRAISTAKTDHFDRENVQF